jgi:hypothetical protein
VRVSAAALRAWVKQQTEDHEIRKLTE